MRIVTLVAAITVLCGIALPIQAQQNRLPVKVVHESVLGLAGTVTLTAPGAAGVTGSLKLQVDPQPIWTLIDGEITIVLSDGQKLKAHTFAGDNLEESVIIRAYNTTITMNGFRFQEMRITPNGKVQVLYQAKGEPRVAWHEAGTYTRQ